MALPFEPKPTGGIKARVLEAAAQQLPRPIEPRPYGADGSPDDLGNLGSRPSVPVVQLKDSLVLRRNPAERGEKASLSFILSDDLTGRRPELSKTDV